MKPFVEFSKKVVKLSVILWVCGAVYGALFNAIQLYIAATAEQYVTVNIDLTGYLMYVAVPLTGGIIGYMAKAAFENREKILQSFKFKKGDHHDRSDTDIPGSDNAGIAGDNGYTHPFDQGEADRSAESKADDVG
ncbi:MAG TPA: hypothetical protein PK114_00105 [Smithellaceae bacterium]|nr:hypothetical protein [Smithellaceae bacterium]